MKHTQKRHMMRTRRHIRIRARVRGTGTDPRLVVFRSNRHVWAQCVDDIKGHTVISVSDIDVRGKKAASAGSKEKGGASARVKLAEAVGELVAKKAAEKKIHAVVFDRGGYKYHGIVKAVAEGARKGGLTF